MKISPRELREAKIPSKAFGFNQDVVDALLERAADTIEGLIEENRQLFEALEQLRNEGTSAPMADLFNGVNMQAVAEPAGSPEPEVAAPAVEEAPPIAVPVSAADMSEKEDLINKTLLLAQRTADETLTTAKAQAEELVSAAQAKADELVANAARDAENLTGSAQEQAQKDLFAAQEQAQKLVTTAEAQAKELVSAAQAKADSIHAQERENFTALIEQLNAERVQLISDIQILQGFDQEHR
ncbi:MAG TPA: DivIVA domain-containing protein, partial [Acidimicrobiia bacterium]|nr:DivIVA domain-containing protein [Acidimicrobiia bacterium]